MTRQLGACGPLIRKGGCGPCSYEQEWMQLGDFVSSIPIKVQICNHGSGQGTSAGKNSPRSTGLQVRLKHVTWNALPTVAVAEAQVASSVQSH